MSPEIVNPIAQGFDVVIRTGSPEDAHMCHSSLSYKDFGPLKYRICAAPSYLQRYGAPEVPEDLRRHNCLILSTQVSASEWRFKGPDGEYVVPVSGAVVSNSHTLICGAALAGMGIARLLTPPGGNEHEADGLISLFEEQTVSRRIVRAFYPRTDQVPAQVKKFLGFMSGVPAGELV
jgi:DNA-binding transcriptional LysR family regulator